MESSLLDSPIGAIEYALQGEGLSVLVAHGAAGGFDQGLLVAAPLVAQGCQLIAPSRDGYLRSPLLGSSSPRSQADKYAFLLDRIGVDSCVILGVSVGGPSAIEFAVRHSRRCRAIVLISSIISSVRPAYLGTLPEPIRLSLLSGPVYRFLRQRAPDRILLRVLGVTSQDERQVSSDPVALNALRELLLAARDPGGLRTSGAIADVASASHLPRYPFAAITIPVLAIHGSKDRFAPLRPIADAVADIPLGQLEVIEGAGHLCSITHRAQVFSHVTAFLRNSVS